MNRFSSFARIPPLTIALLLMAGACGSEGKPAAEKTPTKVELPDLTATESQGKALLTIVGSGGRSKLDLDRSALKSLPQVEETIFEPFIQQEVDFTGVRLWDLLKASGLGSEKEFRLQALDHYIVDLTAEQIISSNAVLATLHNGHAIKIVDGGPVRVVFPTPSPEQRNTDLWIWSVTRIKA